MSAILGDGYRSTFGQAMIGALLLWAALPPLSIAPLAWIAPVFWIHLISIEQLPCTMERPARRLGPWRLALLALVWFLAGLAVNAWFHGVQFQGYWIADIVFWAGLLAILCAAANLAVAKPYLVLFLVGFFFWLAALQWLRLPHWATGFGWLALGFYFACYLPLFIAASRAAVHVLKVPVVLAAPIVWVGLELARAHLLTGMTMGSLGHSQYRWTALIQISDLAGVYGVSFLIAFVAACLAKVAGTPHVSSGASRLWPLLPAAAAIVSALLYGYVRTANVNALPGLRIALIQGSIDTQMNSEEDIRERVDAHYCDLTREALATFPQVDLVVWPETMFYRTMWVTSDEDAIQPNELKNFSPEEFRTDIANAAKNTRNALVDTAKFFKVPMILGVDRRNFGPAGIDYYNTAVLATPEGLSDDYYDKMHLVMFGEYVPFAKSFPWLQGLTPLSVSASHGDHAAGLVVNDICMAPSICYESVLAHVLREQLLTLRQQGRNPRIMVNLTNDGWFWGSNELEMHLACSTFRAVEFRKPMVVAANTGISAWIDGDGRIRAEGPKRAAATLLADVRLDPRESWYLNHGDWPAGVCLGATSVFAAVGFVAARRRVRKNDRYSMTHA